MQQHMRHPPGAMTTAAQLQILLARHGDDFTIAMAPKDMAPGHGYRLIVRTPEGASVYRRDPYALEADFKSPWCVAVNPNNWTWQPWKIPTFDTYLIYEMHVGSFTPEGTLAAALAKLSHVAALGFTCVQVMPVTEHSDLWGYNPRQLMAVHGGYGSAADFQVRPVPNFVDSCFVDSQKLRSGSWRRRHTRLVGCLGVAITNVQLMAVRSLDVAVAFDISLRHACMPYMAPTRRWAGRPVCHVP